MDDPVRLRLLEGDLDRVDARFNSMLAKMERGFNRCEADSDGIRKVMVGVLIAMVTTSITIVATVLITARGL